MACFLFGRKQSIITRPHNIRQWISSCYSTHCVLMIWLSFYFLFWSHWLFTLFCSLFARLSVFVQFIWWIWTWLWVCQTAIVIIVVSSQPPCCHCSVIMRAICFEPLPKCGKLFGFVCVWVLQCLYQFETWTVRAYFESKDIFSKVRTFLRKWIHFGKKGQVSMSNWSLYNVI